MLHDSGDSDVTVWRIAMQLESSRLQRQAHVAIALCNSQVHPLGWNIIAHKSWVNESIGLVCGVRSYDLGYCGSNDSVQRVVLPCAVLDIDLEPQVC